MKLTAAEEASGLYPFLLFSFIMTKMMERKRKSATIEEKGVDKVEATLSPINFSIKTKSNKELLE